MIVQRTGMFEQRVTYVSNLGYVYCTICYNRLRPPHTERDTAPVDNDKCDRCHKPLNESFEVCDASYLIEAVSCKIF